MIDLHCHMLPGIDDGAPDVATSLRMARLAAADGTRTLACTPHIYPGLYENQTDGIRQRVGELQAHLDAEGIDLRLTYGADAHLTPDLLQRLRAGTAPTLAGTRYLLLEPPHHVAPPHFEDSVFELMAAGYTPVITHPERLTWIDREYPAFVRLAHRGVWMQLTAASLTGRFGPKAKKWSERMLDDGLVHILASDGHGVEDRPPRMSSGRAAAALLVGEEESWHLVRTRPQAILDDTAPDRVVPVPAFSGASRPAGLSRWWRRVRRR